MADRIIVVDDEREIADLIGLYLENDGYEVHKFLNGADALSFVEKCEPALAVLDVMLPDTDGFALLRKMREKHDFPIIMLTARVTDSDKILGLTIGADDYITKPFNPLEVTARVKTVLRRCRRGAETNDEMDIRGLTINRASRRCSLFGRELALTPTEGRRVRGAVRGRVEGKIPHEQQQHRHGAYRPPAREDARAGEKAEVYKNRLGCWV